MSRKPGGFGHECVRATRERAERRTAAGREIGVPTPLFVELYMTGPLDGQETERRQFNRLVIQTTNLPIQRNEKFHHATWG